MLPVERRTRVKTLSHLRNQSVECVVDGFLFPDGFRDVLDGHGPGLAHGVQGFDLQVGVGGIELGEHVSCNVSETRLYREIVSVRGHDQFECMPVGGTFSLVENA